LVDGLKDASAARFGVTADFVTDPQEFGPLCERLGLDLITVGEATTEFRDPFQTLSLLAVSTDSARLATGVTTPRLRHPAVLANCIATLDQLSRGRALLGMGNGALALAQLGEPPATVAELLAYTRQVQALSSGESVDQNGRSLRLRWATRRLPVLLAADGPRMLTAAGECADVVLVGQASTPEMVRFALDRIAAGAARAGRNPSSIEVRFMLRAAITSRRDGAFEIEALAAYGARQVHYLWQTAGAPRADELVTAVRRRKGLVLEHGVAARICSYGRAYDTPVFTADDGIERLERFDLLDWAARQFFVTGSEADIRARVAQLTSAGATAFQIASVGYADAQERRDSLTQIATGLTEERTR
jgi:5,10-methylenetetrahydromethanopterin reductase